MEGYFQTKVNKKGEKFWDIHFWLGSQTSQVCFFSLFLGFYTSFIFHLKDISKNTVNW